MTDRRLTACAALLGSAMAAAALDVNLDDRGVVRFGGELDGVYMGIGVHGPGWSYAHIGAGAVGCQRQGTTVTGELPLPANCQGALAYAVSATPTPTGVDIACREGFTAETEIQGAYVSFFLPAARFEGKPARLPYDSTAKPLPQGTVAAAEMSAIATGFAVELDATRSLVIAADASGQVLVRSPQTAQDGRYEVRFHVWPQGRVVPGLTATRGFRVAVVPTQEVDSMIEAMNPPLRFDAAKPYALLHPEGHLAVMQGRNRLLSVELAIHGLGWSYASQGQARAQATGSDRSQVVQGALAVPGTADAEMRFAEQVTAQPDGTLALQYRLQFPKAVDLNGYQLAFLARLGTYAGSPFTVQTAAGSKELVIAPALADKVPFRGEATGVRVAPDNPLGFAITVDPPTDLLVQDNRGWGGDTVEFRFLFRRSEAGSAVPAGETTERRFTLRLNGPCQAVFNEAATPSRTDTAAWVPFVLPWDSAPVDVSFLNHKPAGKFGFVTTRDGRFVLADSGQEVRFWGTCFSAGANFPSHEESEKIARRLARFGVNIVRTHHADAQWAERHFFPKLADNTREFDAENLDRFDYLMHCLKREGIYVYLDQLVNRFFKAGDGVDAVADLPVCGKPYSNFDPRLIELQKEYSKALWTHVNPYTGLAYKDDPAIALMEFANENDLFTQPVTLEPYRSRLEVRYRDWAARHQVDLPAAPVDFTRATDPLVRFFVEVQADYYRQMDDYLRREVGVRVPITGSNWSRNAALLAALAERDFTDSHAYHGHPAEDGTFGNVPMLESGGTIMDGLGFQRLPGKPFFVSEWDEPWPNEWRAELPLWIAAVSAFQGWNGLTVYTYRHTVKTPVDSITGAFETFNDPARFGLFANAALIFRRGDVREGGDTTAVVIPADRVAAANSPTPWSAGAYRGLAEQHRFVTALGTPPAGAGKSVAFDAPAPATGPERTADTGEIHRDVTRRVVTIDTDRTQVVQGFLAEAGTVSTRDLTVQSATSFCTIAVSSLGDAPLRTGDRLLLTAVGRAENTGFAYSLTRSKRLAAGSGPILIDPVQATIRLRRDRGDLAVVPIGADGQRLPPLSTSYADGWLSFAIGPEAKTIFYALETATPAGARP